MSSPHKNGSGGESDASDATITINESTDELCSVDSQSLPTALSVDDVEIDAHGTEEWQTIAPQTIEQYFHHHTAANHDFPQRTTNMQNDFSTFLSRRDSPTMDRTESTNGNDGPLVNDSINERMSSMSNDSDDKQRTNNSKLPSFNQLTNFLQQSSTSDSWMIESNVSNIGRKSEPNVLVPNTVPLRINPGNSLLASAIHIQPPQPMPNGDVNDDETGTTPDCQNRDNTLVGAIRVSRGGVFQHARNSMENFEQESHQDLLAENNNTTSSSENEIQSTINRIDQDILVEAMLVEQENSEDDTLRRLQDEEAQNVLVMAEPLVETKPSWDTINCRKMNKPVILLWILFTLAILGLSTGLACTLTNNCRMIPASAKNSDDKEIARLLKSLSTDTLNKLADPTSPQSMAYNWLKEDIGRVNPNTTRRDKQLLQRFVLAVLYFSTGGPNWLNSSGWLEEQVHECEWFSKRASDDGKHVCNDSMDYEALILPNNSLTGSLPGELGLLTTIKTIDLSNNKIASTFPSEIQHLAVLEFLYLDGNILSGPVPPELGKLERLSTLQLDRNALTSTIPSEFGLLHGNLNWLYLSDNRLTGSLPTQLGALTQLRGLWANRNGGRLTGTIPKDFSRLTLLEALSIANNILSGTLPSFVFNNLTELEWLQLNGNIFSGSLPAEVGQLDRLTFLDLEFNMLSNTIPTLIGLLTELQMLMLGYNKFSGFVPSELSQLKNLTDLSLAGNSQLGGPISDGICNLLRNGSLLYFTFHQDTC